MAKSRKRDIAHLTALCRSMHHAATRCKYTIKTKTFPCFSNLFTRRVCRNIAPEPIPIWRKIVDPSELLTVDEAAKQARVTGRTMRTYIAESVGPIVTRLGGRVFIQRRDFNDWLKNSRQTQRGAA